MRLKTHSWWGGCGCEWPLHIVPILQAGELKKKSAQHNRKPKGPPPKKKEKKKRKKVTNKTKPNHHLTLTVNESLK